MKQQTMKALVYHGNGTLELMERPVPKLKEDTDAIVRVTLSTICTSDLHILRGAVPRAKPETILGHEFVGEIVETGSAVKGLRPDVYKRQILTSKVRIQPVEKGHLLVAFFSY